ncbi:hypothetical protein ACFXA2_31665, partial [Micromonospora chalcea]
ALAALPAPPRRAAGGGAPRLDARDQAVGGLLGGLVSRQRRIGTICHDAKPKQTSTRMCENHELNVMPITRRFKKNHR